MSSSCKIVVVFFLALTGLFSCDDPPPPRLNTLDLKRVDTLYLEELKVVKKELDSICTTRYESVFDHAVDSIQQLRLQEMEALLQKQ